jgi:NAD(P)-dependent dehydrogenase (short-subunit alcohol dehydrogenase family)
MRGLKDRTALVTGAGSGIGRASAERLAKEGAAVAALDLDAERANATVARIQHAGGRAEPVIADATDSKQVARAIAEIEASESFCGLDILVNSVAFGPRKSLADIELDDWHATIDGSLNSYFFCIKAALPALIASGRGKVVNICSITAHTGYGAPAYTAAKGAILSMTRELAGELAPHRININSVSPGVVETGFNADTLADAAIRERTISLIPWGRLGQPDDIAAAVAFLASADADYVTGADLVVDGAMSSTIAWGDVGDRLKSFHAHGESVER